MPYLLDSNVFIEAKNNHYGFDICPAFWEWLLKANRNGQVVSILEVAEEISKKTDILSEWALGQGGPIFQHPRKNLETAIFDLTNWVSREDYNPQAYRKFLRSTDYWLIVFSLAHGYTLVTHEVCSNSLNIVKIPDVCDYFSINCITPFEMLRTEQVRFVLENNM